MVKDSIKILEIKAAAATPLLHYCRYQTNIWSALPPTEPGNGIRLTHYGLLWPTALWQQLRLDRSDWLGCLAINLFIYPLDWKIHYRSRLLHRAVKPSLAFPLADNILSLQFHVTHVFTPHCKTRKLNPFYKFGKGYPLKENWKGRDCLQILVWFLFIKINKPHFYRKQDTS